MRVTWDVCNRSNFCKMASVSIAKARYLKKNATIIRTWQAERFHTAERTPDNAFWSVNTCPSEDSNAAIQTISYCHGCDGCPCCYHLQRLQYRAHCKVPLQHPQLHTSARIVVAHAICSYRPPIGLPMEWRSSECCPSPPLATPRLKPDWKESL